MNDIWRNIGGVAMRAVVATELGQPLAQFLAGSGIRIDDLSNPDAKVTYEQEFQVIRNLLRHFTAHGGDDAGLGIEVGRRYCFTLLGPIGFALVSSASLRSAFDVMLRYADATAMLVPVELGSAGPDLCIRLIDDHLPDDIRRFALEELTAGTLMVAQDLLGRPLRLRALDYRCAEAADDRAYRDFAGVAPRFECARSMLVFGADDVDVPLVRANPRALAVAEEQCRQLLARIRPRGGYSAQVRDYIALRPADIPGMDNVASALLTTARTLRRRLQLEGTTYQSLCDEVRIDTAERLLALQQLSIAAVAERLGYAEPASFIHAFKRWKGLTPLAYRQALLQARSA